MLRLYDTTESLKNQEEELDPIGGMTNHKKENIRLADIAELAGYKREGERLRECGLTPVTAIHKETGETGLVSLYHCRVRLCPVCEWGRARANYARLSTALNWLKENRPGYVPCFLTLTLKNIPADKLRSTISHMMRSFNRLTKYDGIKQCVQGYWRALEVTRNPDTGHYHPHIHVLLLMVPGYACKGGPYITKDVFIKRWRQALREGYDPSVKIQRVGYGKDAAGEHKAVLEVTKYVVKSSDMFQGSDKLKARIFRELRPALAGVRLVGAGGMIKEALELLKLGELDDPLTPETMSIARRVQASPADWILLYWRWGASGYVLDGRKDGAEEC